MKNFSFPSLNEVESFRNTLNSEQGVFGPFMITGDPAFVECAGYAGYDFVLLDMEHGPVSFERLQNLIRAANIAKIMPVVRVPRGSDIFITNRFCGTSRCSSVSSKIFSNWNTWHMPVYPVCMLWGR